jgi:hypothetical protein
VVICSLRCDRKYCAQGIQSGYAAHEYGVPEEVLVQRLPWGTQAGTVRMLSLDLVREFAEAFHGGRNLEGYLDTKRRLRQRVAVEWKEGELQEQRCRERWKRELRAEGLRGEGLERELGVKLKEWNALRPSLRLGMGWYEGGLLEENEEVYRIMEENKRDERVAGDS